MPHPTRRRPAPQAAAIAASALLELAVHTGAGSHRAAAATILHTLATKPRLLAAPDDSVAVLAACEHDCGDAGCTVIEADYYLFEALRRFDGHLPRAGAPP